jgi:hypothetical protein
VSSTPDSVIRSPRGPAPDRRSRCSGTGRTSPAGDDLGEATYATQIKPGEEIHGNGGQRLRVIDVVPFEEEDESPFVGLLQVEAA